MNQLNEKKDRQVWYLGRWVDQDLFRVYVYNASTSHLCNSYDEYIKAIESGLWFATPEEVKPKQPIQLRASRKKDGANS